MFKFPIIEERASFSFVFAFQILSHKIQQGGRNFQKDLEKEKWCWCTWKAEKMPKLCAFTLVQNALIWPKG